MPSVWSSIFDVYSLRMLSPCVGQLAATNVCEINKKIKNFY
jgi:hypothetical protein